MRRARTGATAPISWPTALRRPIAPGSAPSVISSHGAVSILSAAARPSSVSSKSFLLPSDLGRDEQAFVDEQLQRRVDRAGARLPQLLAALVDLLDHLVAVHRPVGEQLEDRGAHVTAPAASAAAGSAAPAAAAAGAEAEAGPKPPGRSRDRSRPKPGPKPASPRWSRTWSRNSRRPACAVRAAARRSSGLKPKPKPKPGRPSKGPSGGVNGVFMVVSFVCQETPNALPIR